MPKIGCKRCALILFLLFVLLVSLVIRFPYMYSYHERGSDSFFYHKEVNVLLYYHNWTWFLHPLSLWGLYPYSDSPGSPFIVAEISLLSNLTVESSIIIYDFLFVLLGVLGIFLLGYKIKRNIVFAFFLALTLSLAPKAVDPMIFSLDERAALSLMIPLWFVIIYLSIQNINYNKRFLYYVLLGLYSFVMSTIHLMFIFSIPFLIGFLIIVIGKNLKFIQPIKSILMRKRKILVPIASVILFYSMFIISSFVNIPGFNIDTYTKTAILQGTDPLTILLNVGVSITGGTGILFALFGIIGGLVLIFKKIIYPFEKFFILSSLMLIPFLINRLYIRPFLITVVCIVVGYGALYTIRLLDFNKKSKKNKHSNYKKIAVAIIISSLLISVAFTEYMITRWNERYLISASKIPRKTTSHDFNVAIWMKKKTNIKDIYLTNNEVTGGRISAYSNRIMLPGLYGTDVDNIVFYKLYTNKSELKIKFNKILSRDIYTNKEKRIEVYFDYINTMNSKYPYSISKLRKYNDSYFLYLTYRGARWSSWYDQKLLPSSFCKTAPKYNYKIYENEWYDFFYLDYGG